MASKRLPLLLLLLFTLLGSLQIHARDSQMFNKVVPTRTDNEAAPKEPERAEPLNSKENYQEPNFLPETSENTYGLYGHESGQFPPSTATPNNNQPFKTNPNNNFPFNAKYLPKNYNTVPYVTEPEDFDDSSFSDKGYTSTPTSNKNSYQNVPNNYFNGQQQSVKVFDFSDRAEVDPATFKNNNNDVAANDNYNSRSNYNNYNTRFMDASFTTRPESNNNNYYTGGSRVNRVQPQGMSDTRFLENGRYYYDTNAEKYSKDPYENSLAMRNQYNPRGYYGNDNQNSYQYNNYNDVQEQYQDDANMP